MDIQGLQAFFSDAIWADRIFLAAGMKRECRNLRWADGSHVAIGWLYYFKSDFLTLLAFE
jgi:hypothetical protein